MLLDSLNENQRKAAEQLYGPVMVFAGAGSGKTRTLTYRIANMIEHDISPYHILAITFTNKATNEMRERLQNLVGAKGTGLTISTFHSFCASLLRKEIPILGYDRHFNIIDEEDQLKIVTDVLTEKNIDKKKFTAKHCRKMINFSKCFGVKPESQIEQMIYQAYEDMMKELNSLDFEDLLLKTLELFQTSKETLEKYQSRYQYILVDEFQDTNLTQYRLLRLLAKTNRNLFVVGDDDQSIYSFRGTNYENIQMFKKDFPEYISIILNQNYRSTQAILDGSNQLISHNKNREPKQMFSDIHGESNNVEISQCRDEKDEVRYVMEIIQREVRHGKKYSDFAILYRSTVISRNFELGCIQYSIPYRIFGGISYLRRKEIKDVIAYLKLIINHDDIASFKRIVNEPTRGIGQKTVQMILDFKKLNKLSLFDAIEAMKDILKNKYKAISSFKEMIESLTPLLEEKNLVEFYEILLDKTQYLNCIVDEEDEEERKENLQEFKSVLYNVENNGEIASRKEKLISAFDEAILSDDKLQNQRQRADGVTLSTVHSVKGLEFDTVFIVAFEEGIFPSLYSYGEANDEEEERRIAYVAVTRAKRKLYLLCAHKRMIYGETRRNSQSRFLLEFIVKEKEKTIEDFEDEICQVENEELFSSKDEDDEEAFPTYHVGDCVVHQIYGEGIVVSLDGKEGQICFAEQKMIKKFNMNHPFIQKKKK